MQNLIKVTFISILLLAFVVVCFFLVSFGYFAAWIYTYNVLTEKRPVAEITVSSIKEDSLGKYFELIYTPIEGENALASIFVSQENKQTKMLQSQLFKLYGDQFFIGGPVIKFYDSLILVNFKNIYKVGEIYGKYTDTNKEKEKPKEAFSLFNLNQGYEDWRKIQEDIQSKNLNGILYSLFVETMQLSSVGKFVTNKDQKYILYISNTGFFLDEK